MRIGIDIGGTFTDFVVYDDEPQGTLRTFKVLSTPSDPAAAVLEGLRDIPRVPSLSIVHGSTVATNALLERKGARTACVTTRGFRDLLQIGRQNRSRLYDFFADRPRPLVARQHCFEVHERVDHQGHVLTPLREEDVLSLVEEISACDIDSVAVCLLFSFLKPDHETAIGQALRRAGFHVSLSSEVLPEFREYERASTTAVNAYLAPVVDRYLGRLEAELPGIDFRILQSNGGSILATQARRQAVRVILSGPAGGVVGAGHLAHEAGLDQVITFDMGGTSSDVSLYQGEIRLTSEAEVDGLPIRIPVIDIHTVGAGGGSLADIDPGGALRVGPQSAGAQPGPVCYGFGGQDPTVTDANLILGRLPADYFLGGEMPLHIEPAEDALAQLGARAGMRANGDLSLAQTAALGVVDVVNAQMERALRVISTERGHDPRDFTLLCFGGAGGLHACELARALGIRRVLVPAYASTLSALGMLFADVIKDYVQTVMLPATMRLEELSLRMDDLERQGRKEVMDQGISASGVSSFASLDLRYVGQSYELSVPLSRDFVAQFHKAHRRAYGHSNPDAPVEIVNLRMRVVGSVGRPAIPSRPLGDPDPSEALMTSRPVVLPAHDEKGPTLTSVPFYLGDRLRPGHAVVGPAVLAMRDTTVFLPRMDHALVDGQSNVRIKVA